MDSKRKSDLWSQLLTNFEKNSKNKHPEDVYKLAIDLLAELPHFNWTGIYWLNGNETLELFDYYIGKQTTHTHIPIGKGVCGTAVAENRDIIVEDVLKLDNYLTCSVETRSEIVVLIRDTTGTILGQIDIDSDKFSAFDETDRKNLETIADQLAIQKLLSVKNI